MAKEFLSLWRKTILPLLILAVIAIYQYQFEDGFAPGVNTSGSGGARIAQAYGSRQSGVWLEAFGTLSRVLSDDTEGAQHQRFVLKLTDGNTVLVAHNIDLAKRVPAKKGDQLTVRGRYEWNERGGVIHWTHHDPNGSISGGWIEHNGQRYR